VALLEFSNLSFGYTEERIIVSASAALQAGNIAGLVGLNGGGKTTLLRLLTGELTPEGGKVQRPRGTRLATVTQAGSGSDELSLYSFVRGGREDLIALEQQIEALSHLAHEADELELKRLGTAQEQYQALGGHELDSEVARLLTGLSLPQALWQRPLGQLSGGQRQKGALARALLSAAQLFILDEPTNHLDLPAQEFLAGYLRQLASVRGPNGERAVLLVSHDRWLLDSVATHIWELEDGTLYRYPGNYSKYLPLREQRREQAREQYQRQQEEIARTEEYIRRNLAGQNTKQAQGRRTLLARMERLDRPGGDPQMKFLLAPALTSGEQVLVVEDLAFGYAECEAGNGTRDTGDEEVKDAWQQAPVPADSHAQAGAPAPTRESPAAYIDTSPGLALNPPMDRVRESPGPRARRLVEGLSFTLLRGERLGILGPNGCGKTTLLKLITRQLDPLAGLIAWGSNVSLGIFSQDSADLQAGNNVITELRRAEPTISDGEARGYLARFGFSGDDVLKDSGSLSGGERSRLSLARIFRKRPNVLVLDEPTNHLDIYAREALEQFLGDYQGTVVMVTHDRALLERICDRLVLFEPLAAESGAQASYSARYFRGSYRDYLRYGWGGATAEATEGTQQPRLPVARPAGPADGIPDRAALAELARQSRTSPAGYCSKQLELLRRRMGELERMIEALEVQVGELTAQQRERDRAGDYGAITRLQMEIDALASGRDSLFDELAEVEAESGKWEQLSASMEA